MELHRRINKLEKEVNLLKTIQVINDNIQGLHSAIEDYENLGFDINDYKPFLDNYPFGVSQSRSRHIPLGIKFVISF